MRLRNRIYFLTFIILAMFETVLAQITEGTGVFTGDLSFDFILTFLDTITLAEIDTFAQAGIFLAVLALFYYAELNIFEQVFLRLEEIIKEALEGESRGIYREDDYPTGVKGMAFAVAFLSANGITGLIGLIAATAMGLIGVLIVLIMHGKLLSLLDNFGDAVPDTTPSPPEPTPPDPPPGPDDEWKPSEGIDVAVKDIISGIEDELEFEEEIMELDEQVVKDLEQALTYIKNNRGLIDDLMRIKFPEESDDVSFEDLDHEMQGIKKSYNIDPTSKQATQQLKQEMKDIHDLLKDALNSLEKKDEAIQKLIDFNSNLGQKIEEIDTQERQALENAIDNLDRCWEYFENKQ